MVWHIPKHLPSANQFIVANFEPGETLLGVVIDWSDAEIKGS